MTTPTMDPRVQDDNNWSDGYTEQTFQPDGKGGNQWEDWGGVQRLAINPPLGALEDSLKRTPLAKNPLIEAEVDLLWSLMIKQLNAPCNHWGLELRFLRQEIRLLTQVLSETSNEMDVDDLMDLDPDDWKEYGNSFYGIPLTKRDCMERVAAIESRVKDVNNLIEAAKREGVYYDICPLLDWFATPPDKRTVDSPSQFLPAFGQELFGVLGIAAQNTTWAHIESIGSRQLAPQFGGSYQENEKTRFRNPLPGMGGGDTASNAPR